MTRKNENLRPLTAVVRTTAGERDLELVARVGDWGVHASQPGPEESTVAHYCGGGGHGGAPGWAVTHVPTGLALVQHIVDEREAVDLAHQAHQACPAGMRPDHCLDALHSLARMHGKRVGGDEKGNGSRGLRR